MKSTFADWSLGSVALLVVIGMFFGMPKPGVTVENAHRLRYGMGIEEVQAIFGGPGEMGGGGFPGFVGVWKTQDLGTLRWDFTRAWCDLNPGEGVCFVNYQIMSHGPTWESIAPLERPNSILAKLRSWLNWHR